MKVIAETAKISAKAGKTSQSDRKAMGEFINFCPIISVKGSQMSRFDVPHMLEQLKRVYVERVVRNGFEDNSLYNDELMKLDDLELQEFDDLKKIIGQTKAMPKTNQVDINSQGLNNEEYEEKEKLEKKPKKELTEEDRKRLEELKKKTKNREAAISILRGISIRMPLLIYGAELSDENQEITIDNFASLIDPQSWEEFMPKGVTKQKFNSFKKYYDPEIFCAAGKRIRAMARAADKLSIEERIERITDIFSTFRNPDKETVLTPWRVVNMHLGDCLGGYNFYDTEYQNVISEPRFIDKGEVTSEVFSPESRILEINSKSGLYPLYMAYGIYRARAKASLFAVETVEEQQAVPDGERHADFQKDAQGYREHDRQGRRDEDESRSLDLHHRAVHVAAHRHHLRPARGGDDGVFPQLQLKWYHRDSDRNPSKNGVYLVEEVTTTFGVGGYRQRLNVPYRIKSGGD